MNKTFVIAGTDAQANDWIRRNITDYAQTHGAWRSLSDYITVSDQNKLRGLSEPHGVFVGTWYERSDIRGILTILLQYANGNSGILKALEVYGEYKNEKQ